MSLVAAEIERQGIPTVIQLYLRELAEKIRPPRSLWVPFPLGYALGEPDNVPLQMSVLHQTFALLGEGGPPPVIKDYVRETAATRA